MIKRRIGPQLDESLAQFPAVALLGARQVGKTSLARRVGHTDAVFLDMVRPADLAKVHDAETYLGSVSGKLVIIDEIQRKPEVFPLLRVQIDQDRRPGRFMLLGSASPDLRRQTAESLAGRVDYLELTPFTLDEVGATSENQLKLLLRGGYPESFLATSDKASCAGARPFSGRSWNRTCRNWASGFRRRRCNASGKCWPICTDSCGMPVRLPAVWG